MVLVPAAMLNSSLVRWVDEPRPAVAYCTTPGFSLASLTRSATVLMPSEGLTTRMLAVSACGATATMSLPYSYLMVFDRNSLATVATGVFISVYPSGGERARSCGGLH